MEDGSSTPEQIGTAHWSWLAMGAFHTCGIREGSLYCWGANGNGQLGNGGTTNEVTPQQVGTNADWTFAAAFVETTCGIRSGGSLWCWGGDWSGQFGDMGTQKQSATPVQVMPGTSFSTVAIQDTVCGITTDGRLFCWGDLPTGITGPSMPGILTPSAPTELGAGSTWTGVAITQDGDAVQTGISVPWFNDVICAIRSDQTLWCWGKDTTGSRGDNGAWRASPVPVTL
jgi:alpha-tubulin suppressor-like RCC1 family protein